MVFIRLVNVCLISFASRRMVEGVASSKENTGGLADSDSCRDSSREDIFDLAIDMELRS